jgi:putative ABC transport system substrate-binding protein
VARNVTVIAAVGGAPSALAAKRATVRLPIVYVIGDDPVQMGLASSLARPGENLTGVTFLTGDLGGKRLSLLCELLPRSGSIGLLLNPGDPGGESQRRDVAAASRTLDRRLAVVYAHDEADLVTGFDALMRERVDGLVVQNDPFFDSQRDRLIGLAARHGMPSIYHIREFPSAGGLMSYGANLVEVYRKAGQYAGRVLKGENVADMPVWRPTTFEFVINVATARALKIAVPQVLLLRADEVMGS